MEPSPEQMWFKVEDGGYVDLSATTELTLRNRGSKEPTWLEARIGGQNYTIKGGWYNEEEVVSLYESIKRRLGIGDTASEPPPTVCPPVGVRFDCVQSDGRVEPRRGHGVRREIGRVLITWEEPVQFAGARYYTPEECRQESIRVTGWWDAEPPVLGEPESPKHTPTIDLDAFAEHVRRHP